MSFTTFDNRDRHAERRKACRKHLDQLEEERSVAASVQTTAGRIESARYFLWEDDDDDDLSTCAFKGGVACNDSITLNAPQWETFGVYDGEGNVDDMRYHQRSVLGSIFSCIGNCCLWIHQALVAACALLTEYLTGLFHCSKRSFLVLGALFAVVIVAVSISAIVKRHSGNGSGGYGDNLPPELNFDDSVVDPARYNSIRDEILASGVTDATDLDGDDTPQNWAIRWLTDKDPAKLEPDDKFMLQRYALATLFFSTHRVPMNANDEWNRRDHWMTGDSICMWLGVECVNSDTRRVLLADNNIHGTIPSEIAALEKLETLDLRQNSFEDTIPTSITSLRHLDGIFLEHNALTGTLATEFGKMKSLMKLYLSNNNLTGSIPQQLKFLTELRILGLNGNSFTGTIPSFIWHLTKLSILYLDSNRLTGSIHSDIKLLRNLEDLRLTENSLNGSIPEGMESLENLETLYLNNNWLTGTVPDIFAKLPNLEEVQLHRNLLAGTLPESLSTLDNLNILYLDNNKLVGTIHESFGRMRNVQSMFLNNNQLTDHIPRTIGEMTGLSELRIFDNKFSGPLPTEIGNCLQLEKLEIHQNQLTGTLPASLGSLEKLTFLTVHNNSFTGTMPEQVCALALLGDISADCNTDQGGTLSCDCCNECHP